MWVDVVPDTERCKVRGNSSDIVGETPLWNANRYLIQRIRRGNCCVGGVDVRQGKHVVNAESAPNGSLPVAKRTVRKADPRFEIMRGRIRLPELTHRNHAARDRCRTYYVRAWASAGRGSQLGDQSQAIALVCWNCQHLVSQTHI